MAKKQSRPQQWAELVKEAREQADRLESAKVELGEILQRFEELKGEYEDWYEN